MAKNAHTLLILLIFLVSSCEKQPSIDFEITNNEQNECFLTTLPFCKIIPGSYTLYAQNNKLSITLSIEKVGFNETFEENPCQFMDLYLLDEHREPLFCGYYGIEYVFHSNMSIHKLIKFQQAHKMEQMSVTFMYKCKSIEERDRLLKAAKYVQMVVI